MKIDYIKNNAALYGISTHSISRVVAVGLGYVLNIILARILGPSIYGDIGILMSIFMLYEIVLTYGVQQSITRFIADKHLSKKSILINALLVQSGFCLLIMLISLLLAEPISNFLNTPYLTKYLYLFIIIIPFEGLYYIQYGLLNGLTKFKELALTYMTYSIVRFGSIVAGILILPDQVSSIIYGTALAYFVAAFLQFKQLYIKEDRGIPVNLGVFMKYVFKALVVFSIAIFYLNIDLLIIKKLENNMEIIGQFKVLSNFTQIVYLMLFSISVTMYPLISRLIGDSAEKLKCIIRRTINLYVVLTFFIFIGLILFIYLIVDIMFGVAYTPISNNIPLYSVGISLLSLNIFLGNTITILGRKKGCLWSMPICMFVHVSLLIILYPKLGVNAGAISLCISQLINIIYFILQMQKNVPSCISFKHLVLFILYSIAFAWSISIFDLASNKSIESFVLALIAFVVYTVGAFLLFGKLIIDTLYLLRRRHDAIS